MKLYTFPAAPSPRRVHLFLNEKGVDVPREIVDLATGEHMKPGFAAINPALTVPALVVDDDNCLVEPIAICHYLEQTYPEPPLMGATALERALVLERNHWIETNGLLAVMEGFRNRSKAMSERALTGSRPVAQIPELAERGVQRYIWFLDDLNRRLGDSGFVVGDNFSLADITAWVTIEFAGWAIRTPLPDGHEHLQRWHASVGSRPAFAGAD